MNNKRSLSAENVIPEVPSSAYYLPNFISEEEETDIIKRVNNAPQPKWTQLRHRRLQNWGGIPHAKGMITEEIPGWLQKYVDRVSALDVFKTPKLPNHVLINEYLPGQGIMAHSDGPMFHPIVTTISCGSHTLLDFYKKLDTTEEHHSNLEFSFLLEPRSLLILQDELYQKYLHSIADREVDHILETVKNLKLCGQEFVGSDELKRGTRLSLTIRHVPKTSKVKLKIG